MLGAMSAWILKAPMMMSGIGKERRKSLGVNEWREVFSGSNVVTKGEAYTRAVIGEERNE